MKPKETSQERAFRLLEEAPSGFLGIDPGKCGAVGYVYDSFRLGEPEGFAVKFLDLSPQEWADWMTKASTKVRFAVLEELAAINSGRGDGQNGGTAGHAGNARSSWKQAENYGMWKYALVVHRIRHDLCRPNVWQSKLECLKLDKTIQRKKALLLESQRILPNISRITLDGCDALLLGVYAAQRSGFSMAQLASNDLHAGFGISGHSRDNAQEENGVSRGLQGQGRGVPDSEGGESSPERKPSRAKAVKAARG